MEKQVDKEKYSFGKYTNLQRWSSYWYQVDEILKCKPESVLEVGVGDNFLSNYLKNNTEIKYKSLDIAEDLNPDIVGSVDEIPVESNTFDLVCAFEVLEHLPYEKFQIALKEMMRVSKKHVIISLPHWGRHFSFEFRLPYFKKIRWQYKMNLFPIAHKFDREHYWEMGKREYSLNKIKNDINLSGFKITKDFMPFYSPYNHFFNLEK
jgi:ubiquinone/menaquinone biosynthesis C-methylase UbiE